VCYTIFKLAIFSGILAIISAMMMEITIWKVQSLHLLE
jgi:hypothetical protein